jgi:peptidoglycan/xylan/chitin deacetylase (PgdA/CDA1 family)
VKAKTLLGLSLLTLAAACSAGPTVTPPKAVAPAAVSATAEAPPARGLEHLVEAISDAGPAGTTACVTDPGKQGFGFFSKDAWKKGEVVLTFDDGPHPTATPRVLDILKSRKMEATFFVVGRNISRETYPLVQRMIADGHALGSHSYSHDVTMTKVNAPKDTVEHIRGQHEVTAIMVDLALMAQSADDFDTMFRKVFETNPAVWLTGLTIRANWRTYLEHHERLLVERGFKDGARPYPLVYSRPPGGGPYVEHDGAAGIAIHNEALAKVGMMNVMWHGAAGDTVPGKRSDFAFLTKNMDKYAADGGVLVIHDYIRADALEKSLDRIDRDPAVSVITMQAAVQQKYACSVEATGLRLANEARADILGRGFLAAAPAVAAKVAVLGPAGMK